MALQEVICGQGHHVFNDLLLIRRTVLNLPRVVAAERKLRDVRVERANAAEAEFAEGADRDFLFVRVLCGGLLG